MKVKEIMSQEIVTVSTKDNVFEAACMMRDQNIGMIPVVEKDQLIGVITDRDIVIRGVAEKRPNSLSVKKIMSNNLVYVAPEMSIDEAVKIMGDAQVRRLPVVENGRLLGVISIGDLANHKQTNQEMMEAMTEISETHESSAFPN